MTSNIIFIWNTKVARVWVYTAYNTAFVVVSIQQIIVHSAQIATNSCGRHMLCAFGFETTTTTCAADSSVYYLNGVRVDPRYVMLTLGVFPFLMIL